jgi:hypothetical protein
VDAAEIARLEFANHMAAASIRRIIAAMREGLSDFELMEAAHLGGLPLGCHATLATGDRAFQGLSGPTGQRMTLGSPMSFNICHWGANICRAGWIARTEEDLPAAARDYVDTFVQPYVSAMSEWCAMMQPGIEGGAVWNMIQTRLPFETFGISLNPGHLIGLDEWVSSPNAEGSTISLASGMAMQMDVIPAHPVYGSTRMEDGYVIADADLQASLERDFPAAAKRSAARRAFMRDVIGMDCPETLLPLSDTCGIVAPFLLDPGSVVAV